MDERFLEHRVTTSRGRVVSCINRTLVNVVACRRKRRARAGTPLFVANKPLSGGSRARQAAQRHPSLHCTPSICGLRRPFTMPDLHRPVHVTKPRSIAQMEARMEELRAQSSTRAAAMEEGSAGTSIPALEIDNLTQASAAGAESPRLGSARRLSARVAAGGTALVKTPRSIAKGMRNVLLEGADALLDLIDGEPPKVPKPVKDELTDVEFDELRKRISARMADPNYVPTPRPSDRDAPAQEEQGQELVQTV
jgi:hypothetical protein